MDGGRQDVELLAAVGAVAVAQQAELLEDVERSIDRRGDRPGIDRPAALDELGPGDMAVGLRQDLDERPPLWRPAQAAGAKPVAHVAPIGVGHGMERSDAVIVQKDSRTVQSASIATCCDIERYTLPSTISPRGPPRDRSDRCQRSRRPYRRERRRPAQRGCCSASGTGSTGTHRGDHRHITSTTAAAGTADAAHCRAAPRRLRSQPRAWWRARASATMPGLAADARAVARRTPGRRRTAPVGSGRCHPAGHAYELYGAVVIALGLAAIAFGALLPEWSTCLMGRSRRRDACCSLGCGYASTTETYAAGRRAAPAAESLDDRV